MNARKYNINELPRFKDIRFKLNLNDLIILLKKVYKRELVSAHLEGKDKIVQLIREGTLIGQKLRLDYDVLLTAKASNLSIASMLTSAIRSGKLVYLRYTKERSGGFIMELMIKKGTNKYVNIIAIEKFVTIMLFKLKKDGETIERLADVTVEPDEQFRDFDKMIIDILKRQKPKVMVETIFVM